MLKTLTAATLVTTMLTGTALANSPELFIEDFVGTIKIENGPSETISIIRDENMTGVNLVEQGDSLKIDGGISDPDGNKCKGYYGSYNIGWFKKERSGEFGGYEDLEDYPQITVRAPKDMRLIIKNSIAFVSAEDLGGTDLDLRYCGKVKLGNVKGDLRAEIRGSADLSAGDVGNVDIDAGNVAGDFIYEAGGAGDLDIGDVMGDRISIDVSGSGDVSIDGGDVKTLKVTASGASEVDYDGTAETADLVATGASDIYVHKVTGEVRRKERGASDISVGN